MNPSLRSTRLAERFAARYGLDAAADRAGALRHRLLTCRAALSRETVSWLSMYRNDLARTSRVSLV